jgi:hypothetical protein
MGLRHSLPAPWLVATVALAGLAAGVLYGKRGRGEPTPPQVPPPTTPAVTVDGPRKFEVPGGPPADVARALEEAVLGTFRGDPDDAALRATRDEAFGRLKGLVAKWGAAAPRDPLASTAWWRAALGRALPDAAGRPRGIEEAKIPYVGGDLALLLSVPPGPGPFPTILVAAEGEDLRGILKTRFGALVDSHLVAMMAPGESLRGDPGLLLLGLAEAERRWPVDRDLVALDGAGEGAPVAANLAVDAPRLFCGAVLRDILPKGPRPDGTALFPVLAPGVRLFGGAKEATVSWPRLEFLPTDAAAAVQAWVAALPRRPSADPRSPCEWRGTTGDLFRSWGPWFVVRKVRDRVAGRPVRVAIRRDTERNAVVLRTENVAEILLLLNDEGLDLGQPVKVVADGLVVEERRVTRSLEVLRNWTAQGEPTLVVTAELSVTLPE